MALRPTSRSTSRFKAPASAKADAGLGRGMEFAIVLLAFLGLGYLLDRLFDTKPVFMIILVVLSLVGQFASMWYGYDARMQQLEAERLAASTSAGRSSSRNQDRNQDREHTAATVAASKPVRIYEPAIASNSPLAADSSDQAAAASTTHSDSSPS